MSTGMTVEYEGKLCKIISYEHAKRGRGDAFARTKIRELRTGKVFSRTLKGTEDLQKAYLEERPLRFMYSSADSYHFMDEDSYEQFEIAADQLGDKVNYLKDNLELKGLFHQGELVTIDLPTFVTLEIADTKPGVKGNTASGGTKRATLETGLELRVPLFIDQGEQIKIDTRKGKYVERA
ncbi:MAG: elongation factor P [Candidatus Acetothermia bacterium]